MNHVEYKVLASSERHTNKTKHEKPAWQAGIGTEPLIPPCVIVRDRVHFPSNLVFIL